MATVTQTLQAKTETTITINWKSDVTINRIRYSTNNGSSWSSAITVSAKSGSYTISGLSANTSYKIKTEARVKSDSTIITTSATTVKTYQWPNPSAPPNFTIGRTEEVRFGISNPLGRTYALYMHLANGNDVLLGNFMGTNVPMHPYITDQTLLASLPSDYDGAYTIKTVYDGHTMTSASANYGVGASADPTVTNITYQDTNSSVVAITGNNQNLVQNKSTVSISCNVAAVQTTVASCSVYVNGATYAMTVSNGVATGSFTAPDSGSDVEAEITVTDARGMEGGATITLHMLEYSLPTAIVTLQRESNYYTETNITVDGTCAYIGSNTVSIRYRYKKTTDQSWSAWATLQNYAQGQFNADNRYEWNVQVEVSDSFGGTTTYNLTLPIGMPIIYFDDYLRAVGINCFPDQPEQFAISNIDMSFTNLEYDSLANKLGITVTP